MLKSLQRHTQHTQTHKARANARFFPAARVLFKAHAYVALRVLGASAGIKRRFESANYAPARRRWRVHACVCMRARGQGQVPGDKNFEGREGVTLTFFFERE